jgi:hypothetical protein
LILNDPLSLVLLDASANDRFFHIVFSLKGFFDNSALPNGFDSWIPYAKSQLDVFSGYVIAQWFSLGGRIMSGYGSLLFETGFFGLLIPLAVLYSYYQAFRNGTFLRGSCICLGCFLLMLSATPLAYPLFAFNLAMLDIMAINANTRFNLSNSIQHHPFAPR